MLGYLKLLTGTDCDIGIGLRLGRPIQCWAGPPDRPIVVLGVTSTVGDASRCHRKLSQPHPMTRIVICVVSSSIGLTFAILQPRCWAIRGIIRFSEFLCLRSAGTGRH